MEPNELALLLIAQQQHQTMMNDSKREETEPVKKSVADPGPSCAAVFDSFHRNATVGPDPKRSIELRTEWR